MGTLFGRDDEMAVVAAALQGAMDGTPTGVLVDGPLGIGKSALLAATVDRAAEGGFAVFHARAEPFERDVPFATLNDAISRAGARGATLQTATPLDVAAVAAAIRSLSRTRPVLVAIDDLQAIDRPSACVLASLLRRPEDGCRLAIAATMATGVRGKHELHVMTERFVTEGALARIALAPLARSDASELAAAAAGAALPSGLDDVLWTATRGHPRYVVEAMRTVLSYPALALAADQFVADPGLLVLATPHAVAEQLDAVGPDPTALARMLSASERFGAWLLPVFADVAGVDVDRAAMAFDALYADGIIGATAAPDEYEFAYPIVRATIHAGLGPAEARRTHAAIAQRMRARGVHQPHAVVALAPHVAESADLGDERAVAELVHAADIVATTAPVRAESWYRRARELLWPTHPDHGTLAARQLRCQLNAGRLDEAIASGPVALELLAPGPECQAAAADLSRALARAGRATGSLAVAEAYVARGPVTARLLVQRACALAVLDRFGEARRDADRAMAMAPDDVELAIDALGAFVTIAHACGELGERDELIRRQLALSGRTSRHVRFDSLADAAAKLAQTGSLAEAADTIAAAETVNVEAGGLLVSSQLDVARATQRFSVGDWSVTDDIARVLARLRPPGPFHQALLLAIATEIHNGRGELWAADELLARLHALPVRPLFAAVATAGVHLARNEPDRAIALLTDRCAIDAERGRRIGRPFALLRLVDAHVAAEQHADARSWAGELRALAASMRFPLLETCAARAASLIADDPGPASQAAAVCARYGYMFEEARSRMELGERGIDSAGNLAAAHDVFTRLGASPWRRRIAASMRSRGMTARRPSRAGSGPLTDTEIELAGHVQAGLTNRQIARAMSLSPKTVEAYLTRLYAKVGAATRVELIVKMGRTEAVAS